LQFQVAYTWSHMIDNSTADFFSTIIAPRRPQDFRNLPAERSNSILDHRHRLVIATIYDAQWYKHDPSWFKRNLLGNYEIALVFTWESGQWGPPSEWTRFQPERRRGAGSRHIQSGGDTGCWNRRYSRNQQHGLWFTALRRLMASGQSKRPVHCCWLWDGTNSPSLHDSNPAN